MSNTRDKQTADSTAETKELCSLQGKTTEGTDSASSKKASITSAVFLHSVALKGTDMSYPGLKEDCLKIHFSICSQETFSWRKRFHLAHL